MQQFVIVLLISALALGHSFSKPGLSHKTTFSKLKLWVGKSSDPLFSTMDSVKLALTAAALSPQIAAAG